MTAIETSGQGETTATAGRVAVVVNSKAGAARASDRRMLTERIRDTVSTFGDVVEIVFVEPRAWTRTLRSLASRPDVDTVVVGGGDGSISSAGTVFVGSGKAMGVIPLGTFNLFARSLRIPIGFDAALAALPTCIVKAVDVGEMRDADGTPHIFLHHVSLGFHPRFIETRDALPFASRIGKMVASLRVWFRTVRSLQRISVLFEGDLQRERMRYYQVAVTVGSFREGFGDFPHAEDLTKGDLDVVMLPARSRLDFLAAAFQAAIGRWRSNSRLDVTAVRRITMKSRRPNLTVSVDGELKRCHPPLSFQVRPKALKVLMPPPEPPAPPTSDTIASPDVLR